MNKLFIIGLPRTGTTSISVALLDHGYKVAHTAFTIRAFELADVISDAPCFSDYRQLDQIFPGSKFVYLERNVNDWVLSIQRLLYKMRANLDPQTGHFNPILKRSFYKVFGLLSEEHSFETERLLSCYQSHRDEVLEYFSGRDDFLRIDIGNSNSLQSLLGFLELKDVEASEFPKLNVGKQVDSWKQYKHPNKVNSNSSGREHRKFFDYSSLN